MNTLPPFFLPVIKRTFRYFAVKHFFQAERLSAKLHPVGIIFFGPAALVFNGKWLPDAIFPQMKFDDISPADHPQLQGSNRHIKFDPYFTTRLTPGGMHPFVENSSFSGQPVFRPLLFNMDQRTLTRTEQQVLKGRDHNQIFFAVHNVFSVTHRKGG